MNIFGIIMAGGSGTRFWPLSRSQQPKQLLNITGKDVLLNEAYDRLSYAVPPENIYVSTGSALKSSVIAASRGRLDESHIITEPAGRDTAACIGYAAEHILRLHGDGIMAVVPSDSYISDSAAYSRTLNTAINEAAAHDTLVVIGMKPSFPATGYGYINYAGKPSGGVFPVSSFTEKPSRETAETYLSSGTYAWNSGIFVCRAGRMLELYRRFVPDIHAELEKIGESLGTDEADKVIAQVYPGIRRISVDYAVIESAAREGCVAMAEGAFGWSDIGTWEALDSVRGTDSCGNVIIGNARVLDSRGCVIHSEKKLTAVIGLTDIIAVDTDDALLICAKNQSQNIKKLVETLKDEGPSELI